MVRCYDPWPAAQFGEGVQQVEGSEHNPLRAGVILACQYNIYDYFTVSLSTVIPQVPVVFVS